MTPCLIFKENISIPTIVSMEEIKGKRNIFGNFKPTGRGVQGQGA